MVGTVAVCREVTVGQSADRAEQLQQLQEVVIVTLLVPMKLKTAHKDPMSVSNVRMERRQNAWTALGRIRATG